MSVDTNFSSSVLPFQDQTQVILCKKAGEIGKSFYHYTRLSNVKMILQGDEYGNHFFYLRNIASMNDLNEAKLHSSVGNKIHSFCTCNSKHEKIPLWYLYSGICGHGVRIGISPGRMLRWLKSIEVVYPVQDGKVNYEEPLHLNNEFELQCGWVYYLMDGKNRAIHRNKQLVMEHVDEQQLQQCFFVKDYPWEYEQEFRIIIINKTESVYERIAIPIPKELICELEIMSAPERPFTSLDKEGFTAMGIDPKRIKNSKLGVCMDLLRNNAENILNQMDLWCGEEELEKICAYICSRKQCHPKEDKK